MTDIQICDLLLDFLDISCPPDVTTTVTGVGLSSIQLGTTIGAIDDWVGGIIEFTSGNLKGQQFVITSSNTDIVKVASPFNSYKTPNVGDTCKITGGPLQEARKYLIEPTSMQHDLTAGKKFFVVVNCTSGSVVPASMNGGRVGARAIESADREYSLEVEIATPNITGRPTAEDAYRVITQLPMLKEQVLIIVQWFRLQEANRMSGEGAIDYTYAFMQPTGMETAFLACIVEFKVRITQ